MTNQEIIEGNAIIAKFRGAKPCKKHPDKQCFLKIKDNKNPSLQYWHLLKYHKSWDWLIPVIDEICSSKYYLDYYLSDLGQFNDGIHINTKFISTTFESVVEYIKWYNKNKNYDTRRSN